MPTFTPNYNLAKPLVNSAVDQDLWGNELNSNLDIIDSQMKTNANNIALYQIVTPVVSAANVSNIDLSLSYVFSQTMTENTTFTFSNPLATGLNTGFKFFLVNGAAGYTPTWPANVKWPQGTIPTLNGANQRYVLVFETIDGGTIWYGALSINEAS